MSDTISDQHIDDERMRSRLITLEGEIARARRGAIAAGDRARDLRAVATELDRACEPLAGLLQPVRDLHTVSTWEGEAATASRLRLDGHEERSAAAVRVIDGLVADLRAEAAVEDQRELVYQHGVDRMLPEYRDLQRQLGYYNGWFR